MTPRALLALGSLLATAELAADALPRRSRLGKRLRAEIAAVKATAIEPLERAAETRITRTLRAALVDDAPLPQAITNGAVDPEVAREQAEAAAGYCEHEIPRT